MGINWEAIKAQATAPAPPRLPSGGINWEAIRQGAPTRDTFLSGGVLSDIFDVLQVGQFATAGLATGKGIRRGIQERASFGELLSPQFRETLTGRGVELALNILGDPLTYVPFGAAVRAIPGARAAGRAVTGVVKPVAQRVGLAFTERQAALQPIRDAMVIAERKGFDGARGLAEDIRKATLIASGGNRVVARTLDQQVGRYFDAGADVIVQGGTRQAAEQAQRQFLAALPEGTRQVVETASQRIVAADNAIVEGLVRTHQLSPETAAKWQGFHLRAIYAKFEHPEDFVEFLEKTDPLEALRVVRQVETGQRFGRGGVGIPTGATAERKLLSTERAGLGEIPEASARVLVGQTLGTQAIARGEALQKIAATFAVPKTEVLNIALRAAKEGPEGFRLTKEFALVPDTARWGWLRNQVIRRDVAEILITGAKDTSSWEKLIGWWKFSKVVPNPSTRARNIRTNLSLAVNAAGIRALDPRLWYRAIREVVTNGEAFRLAKSLDASFVDTFTNSEMRGTLQTLEGLQARGLNGVLEGLVRGLRFLGRTYQMEEQIGKMIVFLAETGRGVPPAAAALKAGKALFNYRNVPPLIEKLRRKGFYPFITFPWKVATEAIPAALERPGRVAAQVKGIRAFTEAPSAEEERALPLEMRTGGFVKPIQALVARLPFLKDAKGNPIAFDLTYELFFGDIGETGTPPAQLVAMFEGRIPFNQALLPLLTPIGQAVAEIVLNKSAFTGAELRRAGEAPVPAALRHAARVALPGAAFETGEAALAGTGVLQRAGLRPTGRLATAVTGTETTIGGAPLTKPLAALGTFAGIRGVSVDAAVNRRARVLSLRGRLNEIEREMRSVARDRGRTAQERQRIIQRLQRDRVALLRQFQELGTIR